MKISIIVPIYNVEKYLKKCIESLINQTYRNIEIILVDDESPDNCPLLCEEYKNKDSRIKVIHKKNGGLSDARNKGLEEATGEYILFVDSDDYIKLDTCMNFINILCSKYVDIVVGNAVKIINNKREFIKHTSKNSKIISGKEYLKKELLNNSMQMMVWLNLYRRDFLLKNSLFFKKGLLHEDEEFTPRAFLKADKVLPTDITFYNYIIRENSITTKKNQMKNVCHIYEICKELDFIYNNLEDKELKNLLKNDLFEKYLGKLQKFYLYNKKDLKKIEINKKFLKDKAYSLKNKIRLFLLLLNTSLYFSIYKKLKNKGKNHEKNY